MNSLSEEQKKKIEQNRIAALLKKQANQNVNSVSVPINSIAKSENLNKNPKLNNFKMCKKESQNQTLPNISAVFRIVNEERFIVDMPYHSASIEIFKTIPGRLYDPSSKKWMFPLTEHNNLVKKLKSLDQMIIVNAVPEILIKIITKPEETEPIDWSRIDKVLRDSLLPFQVEGVRFGINKKGRCLIADDMGLGKTIQALGIACYFKQNWPLLIICPSSMRFPWEEAIKTFLPNINPTITILTSGKDPIFNTDIVISSYELMKNCHEIQKKKFGIIIFDESHFLKSSKSARTKVALQLTESCKNIILLSGTPALSRPQELYSQISAIDPYTFKFFYDFGIRYCDGKKDKFGWNFNGSSNLEELEVYLKKKLMIRRLKSEVLLQLPSKIRKVVYLNPNMIKTVSMQMKKFESEYESQKGCEKHSTLLSYYCMTGDAKLKAVCQYIEEKLENAKKLIVFAHHTNFIKGICDLLLKKKTEYIKIDGSTLSEERQILCNKFQNNKDCKVAVLSLKAANCGITLTEAQLVIFGELYWNPGELIQAEDRAHRIGQQDSVLIEYLIAKGTADDLLWNMVHKKLDVLKKVGLNKESFETDTTYLENPRQRTITSMLKKKISNCETLQENIKFEEIEDDIIFENINLKEIEMEYEKNCKKRKTDLDLK